MYRRGRLTGAVYGALFAFGVLNAGLGPALPFLRAAEHISYLTGALHQIAFAVGGGIAGWLAGRPDSRSSRALAVRAGLLGAAVAWVVLGVVNALAVTVAAAFAVSLFGSTALIRMWALLADLHGHRRAVVLSEGEVAVSIGSVLSPLLVSLLAGTTLGWRSSFVLGALLVVATALPLMLSRLPAPTPAAGPASRTPARGRLPATLVLACAVVAAEFSLSFWLASYLDDEVGLSPSLAAGMVGGLYVANVAGRLLTSVLARRVGAATLLRWALALFLVGMPILLLARGAAVAGVAIVLIGVGIAALFPLTSSLHIAAGGRDADSAVGQILAAASIGQILGPAAVALLAEPFGLRIGLLTTVGCGVLAAAALARR